MGGVGAMDCVDGMAEGVVLRPKDQAKRGHKALQE